MPHFYKQNTRNEGKLYSISPSKRKIPLIFLMGGRIVFSLRTFWYPTSLYIGFPANLFLGLSNGKIDRKKFIGNNMYKFSKH